MDIFRYPELFENSCRYLKVSVVFPTIQSVRLVLIGEDEMDAPLVVRLSHCPGWAAERYRRSLWEIFIGNAAMNEGGGV